MAKDSDQLFAEVSGVVNDLENSERQSEVDVIREEDPMTGLRNALVSFIETRLSVIEEEEHFRKVIKDAIKQKVQDDEVSIPQLIDLLKTVDKDTTQAVDSVLGLLKPGNSGEVSPIFQQQLGSNETSDFPSGFENLEPDQAEALHKLGRIIQAMEQNQSSGGNEST